MKHGDNPLLEVMSCTMHLQVPLETLSSELDAYLAVLRNRLLEVINEHYADFVSLSSRLINVDTAVLRMQRPLLEIKVADRVWLIPSIRLSMLTM
jgi:hypothetical protein